MKKREMKQGKKGRKEIILPFLRGDKEGEFHNTYV